MYATYESSKTTSTICIRPRELGNIREQLQLAELHTTLEKSGYHIDTSPYRQSVYEECAMYGDPRLTIREMRADYSRAKKQIMNYFYEVHQ